MSNQLQILFYNKCQDWFKSYIKLIVRKEFASIKNNIRALEISNLNTSAQIDNYLLKTINYAKVVVLRIFGDKGTWNYGIEQL